MSTASLEQSESQGVRHVRVSGSLTQKGVTDVGPAFTAATRGASGAGGGAPVVGTVVVDLSAVDVIATTGITMLLVADRELKQAGGKMVIAGTRGVVRDVLLRCRLDKVLSIAPAPDVGVESARR
jgi:anti-anti-sigma factor